MPIDADPRPGTSPLADTALGALGIELVACSADGVEATMPSRHGRSAMLVLAETVASTAAGLAAGEARRAFGAQLNASQLATPRGELVRAAASPLELGHDLHAWRIEIVDEQGTPVLEGRCTLSVVDAPD